MSLSSIYRAVVVLLFLAQPTCLLLVILFTYRSVKLVERDAMSEVTTRRLLLAACGVADSRDAELVLFSKRMKKVRALIVGQACLLISCVSWLLVIR